MNSYMESVLNIKQPKNSSPELYNIRTATPNEFDRLRALVKQANKLGAKIDMPSITEYQKQARAEGISMSWDDARSDVIFNTIQQLQKLANKNIKTIQTKYPKSARIWSQNAIGGNTKGRTKKGTVIYKTASDVLKTLERVVPKSIKYASGKEERIDEFRINKNGDGAVTAKSKFIRKGTKIVQSSNRNLPNYKKMSVLEISLNNLFYSLRYLGWDEILVIFQQMPLSDIADFWHVAQDYVNLVFQYRTDTVTSDDEENLISELADYIMKKYDKVPDDAKIDPGKPISPMTNKPFRIPIEFDEYISANDVVTHLLLDRLDHMKYEVNKYDKKK